MTLYDHVKYMDIDEVVQMVAVMATECDDCQGGCSYFDETCRNCIKKRLLKETE